MKVVQRDERPHQNYQLVYSDIKPMYETILTCEACKTLSTTVTLCLQAINFLT